MEDVAYYSRRAQQERTAALQTDDLDVREVHLELAEAYEAKVRDLAASLPRLSSGACRQPSLTPRGQTSTRFGNGLK